MTNWIDLLTIESKRNRIERNGKKKSLEILWNCSRILRSPLKSTQRQTKNEPEEEKKKTSNERIKLKWIEMLFVFFICVVCCRVATHRERTRVCVQSDSLDRRSLRFILNLILRFFFFHFFFNSFVRFWFWLSGVRHASNSIRFVGSVVVVVFHLFLFLYFPAIQSFFASLFFLISQQPADSDNSSFAEE